MAINFSVQSLQFRRRNKQGKLTLRYVWDVVSRTDAPARMLIETWGGKPDGYIRAFGTDLLLGHYLSGRIAKGSAGASDGDLDLDLVGAEDYRVSGQAVNLVNAIDANNHEKAKLRLQISGMDVKWDEHSCLNKVVDGISDFDEDTMTVDQLTQAMGSRVRLTFKRDGKYIENLIAVDEFMASAKDMSDVLGGEASVYAPMDRERIAEVIQVADGLRDKISAASVDKPRRSPKVIPPEPIIERGAEWGGWA